MPPPSDPPPSWKSTLAAVLKIIPNDPVHPVRIALRTYSLCLSISLGPALLPLIFAPLTARPNSFKARTRSFWHALAAELRPTGLAPAITVAVGGGAALQRLWDWLERRYTPAQSKLSPYQRAFLANMATSTLAITLLRRRRHKRLQIPSPTLDLSLLFFVRALDASMQAALLRIARVKVARDAPAPPCNGETSDTSLSDKQQDLARKWQKRATGRLDALIFWASCARIMWCFFYLPQRLPLSYEKWINSLAHVDRSLVETLRAVREGTWSYVHGLSPKPNNVVRLAEKLGHPESWGDPTLLPAYGGDSANEAWKQLGVSGRNGLGGLPCELVHGTMGARFGIDNSCVANAAIRALHGFPQTLIIYLPVHFLPILLTNPRSIMDPRRAIPALLSAIRSATFLSTFLSSCWFGVCLARTLVLARLFPYISHDVWDGPYGGTLTGSLLCGASIWIENAKRRGELAFYVLPKALKALIPETWLHSRHPVVHFAESLTFILSLASLLTFAVHQPESLRGLARWTLTFVMKGSTAGFWEKRKREITTCSPTPVEPSGSPLAGPNRD